MTSFKDALATYQVRVQYTCGGHVNFKLAIRERKIATHTTRNKAGASSTVRLSVRSYSKPHDGIVVEVSKTYLSEFKLSAFFIASRRNHGVQSSSTRYPQDS